MTKILRKLGTLCLAASATVAWAGETYTNQPLSFTWTVGNEVEATVTEDGMSAVVSNSKYSAGTDLAVTTAAQSAIGSGTLATYKPATSNPGNVASDMIVYSVKVKKGYTFTPTSITYDAVKIGTDGAYFSWSYSYKDADGKLVSSDTLDVNKSQILRNNGSNSSTASLTHNEAISNVEGREFYLRFFISNTANNKSMSIGNVKINGTVSGTEAVRAFKDFAIDFTSNPYTVTLPTDGNLPSDVVVPSGTWHDKQHGYQNTTVTVPVDGPVKFTFGGCNYTNAITVKKLNAAGTYDDVTTLDSKTAGCDGTVSYTYNEEEAATLQFYLGSYCPSMSAAACEKVENVNVVYYDVDGKTVIGTETIEGSSALKYAYGAENVTVAEGQKFRGWFNDTKSTATKVAEGTSVDADLKLYAKATDIEVPTSTSRFVYELNKNNFYAEDHEAITFTNGKFHDTTHGFAMSANGTIQIPVKGKAVVSAVLCQYSSEGDVTVTDANGKSVATFAGKATNDGSEASFQYDGGETTLTLTFPVTTYVHKMTVSAVESFPVKDETTGVYEIAANDGNAFRIALAAANQTGNATIFLHNGTYDLGEDALTSISGNNISIIGESMDSTIIKNAPLVENEGIGTTATLLNTSDGLYMQDLTIQNALDYYASGSAGRAVCLQDKGSNTICKNVKLLSYQDTYYSNKASNFYFEDCEIHGTVDYLCGDGNVIYNRTKFVNESRSKDKVDGDCTIAAPYNTATTDARYNWGYVFLDCSVETKSKTFNFARSWGGESKATFINTTLLDGNKFKDDNHFTIAGMNVAAASFKEYNTIAVNEDGTTTQLTPDSKEVTFTHSSGNKTYDIVLTANEVKNYTVANIFGQWEPDYISTQCSISDLTLSADKKTATWETAVPTHTTTAQLSAEATNKAEAQLVNVVYVDGTTDTQLVSSTQFKGEKEISAITVRAANARGGFGPATTTSAATGIKAVDATATTAAATGKTYNLSGQEVNASYRGIVIQNGTKYMQK